MNPDQSPDRPLSGRDRRVAYDGVYAARRALDGPMLASKDSGAVVELLEDAIRVLGWPYVPRTSADALQ